MPRLPIRASIASAAFCLLLAACNPASGTPAPGSETPGSTSASPTAGPSDAITGRRDLYSSAGLVFDTGARVLQLPDAGQPRPTGPLLTPNFSIIGGGPTEAGATTIEDIVRLSYADVDAFWGGTWESGYPTIFYRSPVDWRLYDSSQGEIPESTCAAASEDPQYWSNNAFYCYGDSVLVYDVVLANDELNRIGDFAVVATVAHEWGHHLQNLILGQPSVADRPTFSIEAELQADCFAGMYAAGAELAGSFPVSVEDIQEAAAGFYESGGSAGYGWFEPLFHGTPEDREGAFYVGYSATDVRACDVYATWMIDLTLTAGPYAVGYLDGASVSFPGETQFAISGGPYGDVTVSGAAYTFVADQVSPAMVEVATAWAPNDASGSGLSVLGEVEDHTTTMNSWGIPGNTSGLFYTYAADGSQRHGYLIISVNGDHTALVLDVWMPGEGTTESWAAIIPAATQALRSFQAPGVL